MKIMIVDDHPEMRRLLRRALASFAAEFSECGDGDEAIAHCEQFQPDIVIMDLHMPKMGGLEATARLLSLMPNAAVFIVSQSGDATVGASALRSGAKGYLSKDSFELLVQRIASHCQTL